MSVPSLADMHYYNILDEDNEAHYIAIVFPDKVLRRWGSSLITSGLIAPYCSTNGVESIDMSVPILLDERRQT
jgi:hypothetical protein